MTNLGCAESYSARIHYQEGTVLYMDLPEIIECRWSRLLDEASEAFVSVSQIGMSPDCCEELGKLDAWGFELSIYRDTDLVWQGPIYEVTYYANRVEIVARDVIAYLDRRLNETTFDYTPTGSGAQDVGFIFNALINNGLAPYDPNLLPFLTWETVGITTQRKATLARSVVIGDELRDLSRIGLDFTTMGRAIVATKERIASAYVGTPIVLSEDDFFGELKIQVAGSETATWVTVLGDGAIGSSGGTSSFYGRIQRLERAERIIDNSSAVAMSVAIRKESNPTPVYVVIPPDGRLAYEAPITVEQLVCGSRIDIYTRSFCRNVSMSSKLTRVTGYWTAEAGEEIGISVKPLPTS